MPMESALKSPARSDKWYVGGGRRLIFAPPFPQWLATPGFWDEAHFYEHRIQPVFAVTLLDGQTGVALKSREATDPKWTPASSLRLYSHGSVVSVETRGIGEGDALISELTFQNNDISTAHLHVVLWTVEDTKVGTGHGVSLLSYQNGIVSYRMNIAGGVWTALALVPSAISFCVQSSEGSAIQPRWEVTPFQELWIPRRLPSTMQTEGVTRGGLMYIALHTPAPLAGKRRRVVWAMRSFGTTKQEAVDGIVKSVEAAIAPPTYTRSTIAQGRLSPSRGEEAGMHTLAEIAAGRWNRFGDGVPKFACSDPVIEKYFNYRLYGIHLNTLAGGFGAVKYPAVAEGIAYFRSPISYSAQILVNETRWMRDPA
ncbi:MAG: hypothetical protein ACREJQ_05710, partial [bacterium]